MRGSLSSLPDTSLLIYSLCVYLVKSLLLKKEVKSGKDEWRSVDEEDKKG